MSLDQDRGPQFEDRARALARARHDPLGLQGAAMVNGREIDGVFIDGTTIAIYEFTTERKMEKAKYDAEKIAETIRIFGKSAEYRHKFAVGYLVTREEPTADQRTAISEVCKRHTVQIHAMSYIQLQQQLINTEDYISKRLNGPFGSAGATIQGAQHAFESKYVEPSIQIPGSSIGSLNDVLAEMTAGARIAIVGDYGIGKSEACKQLFFRMRKAYFKSPHTNRFPVHINLRDCYGLKSPSEIFRRHAEEIGFATPDQLVSAWRAGRTNLILDGFDEMVPVRWVGSVKRLVPVRRSALTPVRELIEQTPAECGVVISGRPQYFASTTELAECLGIDDGAIRELRDFNEEQALRFAEGTNIPEWLPTRPLVIDFYRHALESDVESMQGLSAGQGWHRLIRMVAKRESQRVSTIDAETFVDIFSRIATVSRRESDGREISVASMESVFRDVCGYAPDEEGMQALLRLPGLASTTKMRTTEGRQADEESRTFVDEELANAAFAVDLAKYIEYPHGSHPINEESAWFGSSTRVVWEIAAEELSEAGYEKNHVRAAIGKRINDGRTDAVLFDLLGISEVLGVETGKASIPITGVMIESLRIDEVSPFNRATFKDCVIERIDVTESSFSQKQFPHFSNTIIGRIDGISSIPESIASRFDVTCEIGELARAASTVSEIVSLDIPKRSRVALTVLRKVYAQAGSARRMSALQRGLPQDLREMVDGVISEMSSAGLIVVVSGKSEDLVTGSRAMRARVLDVLEAPGKIGELLP